MLMEDDMPSFSHPQLSQLPSSMLLHAGSHDQAASVLLFHFILVSLAL